VYSVVAAQRHGEREEPRSNRAASALPAVRGYERRHAGVRGTPMAMRFSTARRGSVPGVAMGARAPEPRVIGDIGHEARASSCETPEQVGKITS